MWPFTLSGRLTIFALVGLYPTNKLIVRKLILQRQQRGHLSPRRDVCSINLNFLRVFFTEGQILTRYSPVRRCTHFRRSFLARLACVRHAASVHSEPGSNSPLQKLNRLVIKLTDKSVYFFVNFKDFFFSISAFSTADSLIIIHTSQTLSTNFINFFKNKFTPSKGLSKT